MAANIFGGGLTGLLCSLIVCLRDLPFAVDHIGETRSDFINDFFFQVPRSPESELVLSNPDEEGPDSLIINFAFVPPPPSQLESVSDFPAFQSASPPPISSANLSASVHALEFLEFWKAIKNRDQRRESRLVFSDPIKERRLRLPAAAIRKKRRWP